ncbi:MAG: iron-sulfur cluster assembly scaffold protein [Deltaproteobacteria bacterium]|nr:iron-sulfur cluster assembly scaffold protein [Deltaproteobacteria bacterium]MBW2048139.1 iron-sulfur cluster assembly scaffold protein [Deltaproteobacteria bacterium]MBW2110879.1 iron-sulfur cluster assembly scaffold protein [Deltaproteobacteria bacterium]MBW2353916.1 iron-sulfur cluster assembly scaffold protein [Deltaproteobacteria bacterium]
MGLTMIDYVLWFFLICVVLLVITGLWIGVYYWLSPHLEDPDGKARITGACMDTMEICLRFRDDRVSESSYWTDGCAQSLNCVCRAAELAKGKSPDEILQIDEDLIRESVGGLPEDRIHCARLAAETLQAALDDFMRKRRKGRVGSSTT